jgi:hypothetical protein
LLGGDGFLWLALRSRAGEADAPDAEGFRPLLRTEIGAERHYLDPRLRIGAPVNAGLPGLCTKLG